MNMMEMNMVNQLPPEYRPLSPWAYFGYTLLFSIPLVGFICLVVMALSNSNINRRNFARSYFCVYVLIFIVVIVMLIAGVSFSALRA